MGQRGWYGAAVRILAGLVMIFWLGSVSAQPDWLSERSSASHSGGRIHVAIGGWWPNSGIPRLASAQVQGSDLVIELRHPSGGFAAFRDWQEAVNFGPLPAGVYNVVVVIGVTGEASISEAFRFTHVHELLGGGPSSPHGVPLGGAVITIVMVLLMLGYARRRLGPAKSR